METILEIIQLLQSTNSIKEKKNILLRNKDNVLLQKTLKFLLDTNIITGLSKKKLSKTITNKFDDLPIISSWEECMEYLLEHSTGTDLDIAVMQSFISSQQSESMRELYYGLISKSLKIGCNVTTINSVFPNLIPVWEVQQAYLISDTNKPKGGEKFYLTRKLNGVNCGYYKDKLIGRQGNEFSGLEHIINEIHQLPYKNMFINGELMRKNIDHIPDNDNFQLSAGIINSKQNIDKTNIEFVIYEMFPNTEFDKGKYIVSYAERRILLNELDNAIKTLRLSSLRVVPVIYQGEDIDVIPELLHKADEAGWEGLMLNKAAAPWLNKRNNGILKIKSFKRADIKCVQIHEGDGRLKNTMGWIDCDYKGNILKVGSGFTDRQRQLYWEHPEFIINKIVEVQYKNETRNKNGGISVQFPVFIQVRNDKDTINIE